MSPSTTSMGEANGSHKNKDTPVPSRLYGRAFEPSLNEFKKLCLQQAHPSDYPLAASVASNVPIYQLPSELPSPQRIDALQDEWNHVLLSGPGVFVVKNLYSSRALLDQVNKTYARIVASESTTSTPRGDHFASSGRNSRIWNSFSKHCLADPASFAAYYANPWLAVIAASWLGPNYRITAQVNTVHAGGAPQVSHRDYHLGFQTADACQAFPRAMQTASQLLTLQGAVAHTNMPVKSGPTRLLPFSQQFAAGYMAYRLPAFDAFFLENYVSLPLEQGDGLFFNPGLHHAAGQNQTKDFSRSANLLQISSAFGKTMETIETVPLVEQCWNELVHMHEEQGLSAEVRALIAAVADGYPFPTNLDRRPPAPSGMAPESEQEIISRGLERKASREQVLAELTKMKEDSRA